ncbi:MAG: carbohydrate-binding domain-containing protein [Eubacterium sp.]|nr:carbohydrate-binding domain-containing protein [Eubacterium sp.]
MKKLIGVILTISFVTAVLPQIKSTVSAVTTYDVSDGPINISQGGDYIITGTVAVNTTSSYIAINQAVTDTVNITLNNVNISSNEPMTILFALANCEVNMTLIGSNYFTKTVIGNRQPVITSGANSSLVIGGSGELIVTSYQSLYSAISGRDITVNSGRVVASNIDISNGRGLSCRTLKINGGEVIAKGYMHAIDGGTVAGKFNYQTSMDFDGGNATSNSGTFIDTSDFTRTFKYVRLTTYDLDSDYGGDDLTRGYEIWSEAPNRAAAYVKSSDGGLDVWIGGGKIKRANGAVIDNKSVQLNLFMYDDGFYNVTKNKTTQWAGRTSGGQVKFEKYKLKSDTGTKDIAKISKGKVTAGKKPGSFYAVAYAGIDKKAKAGGFAAEVMINVRESSRVIEFKTSANGGETSKLKAVEVELNDRIVIYPVGYSSVKKSVKIAADENCTYNISVEEKSTEYIGISKTSSGATSNTLKELTKSDFDNGVWISGIKQKNNKNTKASLIIQNDQSGKKTKLTVTVGRSVSADSSGSSL